MTHEKITQHWRWIEKKTLLIKKLVNLTRSNTRKPRKSWKVFSEIFESEFSILAVGKKRKLGITFPTFPRFPSFRFATFSFSVLILFSFCKCFFKFVIIVLQIILQIQFDYLINEIWFLVFMFWSTESIKCICNIEYKMYLQNEKMAKLWVFVDFSNKRRFEQIYKTSLQNETVR